MWCALASVGQSVSHVKNLRGSTPQGSKYSLPKNVRLGGSILAPITFLYVDQSSRNFFRPTWKGLWLLKYSSDLRYVDPFRSYSQTKVESCQKSRRILNVFFALPNFRGRAFQSYTLFITPASQHVAWKKFCEDTPTSPEVIRVHTLNFRPK